MEMRTVPLHRLAKTIRSKNAGPFFYTFDIIFADRASYERVRRSGVITRELVQKLFGVTREEIAHFVEYDPGNAIKITVRRPVSSGDVGDADLYGCQQYAPLLDIPIPWEQEEARP
jgi:hypothetical protein